MALREVFLSRRELYADGLRSEVGVFTDGDLRRVLKKYTDIKDLSLFKVMTKRPVTISREIICY